MLRLWTRILLLIGVLGVYCVHAAAAQHHLHEQQDPGPCAACVFQATPGVEPGAAGLPLPLPPATPTARAIVPPDVDPPPALSPADVSFATSPPHAPARRA